MRPRRRPAIDVAFTKTALAEIRRVSAWWLSNRPSALGAVADEIDRVVTLIGERPFTGTPSAGTRRAGVRRYYLPRIGYFLFYRVTSSRVVVLSLWHASRGNGPPI